MVDNPRPPLTANVIKAIKEIEYYMRNIQATEAKISQIGTFTLTIQGMERKYTPLYQDMEMERIVRGWPPEGYDG